MCHTFSEENIFFRNHPFKESLNQHFIHKISNTLLEGSSVKWLSESQLFYHHESDKDDVEFVMNLEVVFSKEPDVLYDNTLYSSYNPYTAFIFLNELYFLGESPNTLSDVYLAYSEVMSIIKNYYSFYDINEYVIEFAADVAESYQDEIEEDSNSHEEKVTSYDALLAILRFSTKICPIGFNDIGDKKTKEYSLVDYIDNKGISKPFLDSFLGSDFSYSDFSTYFSFQVKKNSVKISIFDEYKLKVKNLFRILMDMPYWYPNYDSLSIDSIFSMKSSRSELYFDFYVLNESYRIYFENNYQSISDLVFIKSSSSECLTVDLNYINEPSLYSFFNSSYEDNKLSFLLDGNKNFRNTFNTFLNSNVLNFSKKQMNANPLSFWNDSFYSNGAEMINQLVKNPDFYKDCTELLRKNLFDIISADDYYEYSKKHLLTCELDYIEYDYIVLKYKGFCIYIFKTAGSPSNAIKKFKSQSFISVANSEEEANERFKLYLEESGKQ